MKSMFRLPSIIKALQLSIIFSTFSNTFSTWPIYPCSILSQDSMSPYNTSNDSEALCLTMQGFKSSQSCTLNEEEVGDCFLCGECLPSENLLKIIKFDLKEELIEKKSYFIIWPFENQDSSYEEDFTVRIDFFLDAFCEYHDYISETKICNKSFSAIQTEVLRFKQNTCYEIVSNSNSSVKFSFFENHGNIKVLGTEWILLIVFGAFTSLSVAICLTMGLIIKKIKHKRRVRKTEELLPN